MKRVSKGADRTPTNKENELRVADRQIKVDGERERQAEGRK